MSVQLCIQVLIQWFFTLTQLLLDLLFQPPKKTNKVTCYSVLYRLRSKSKKSQYLRKFTCTRDVRWLFNKDVHLFSVSGNEFVFARTSPTVNFHNIADHPTLDIVLSKHVVEFGVVSADLAIDVMRDTKDDGSNIGFLHNLGGFGPALVTDMIHKTGQCHVVSEPGPLLDISNAVSTSPALLSDPRTVSILRTVLLFLAKCSADRYFIRVQPDVMNILPLIHRALPGVREAFLYGALRPIVLSQREETMKMLGGTDDGDTDGLQESAEKSLLFSTISRVYCYLREVRPERSDIIAFSYESLVSNPPAFTSHLLDHLGLGSEWTELALTGMDQRLEEGDELSLREEEVALVREMAEREYGIVLEGKELEIAGMPNRWDEIK